MNQLASVAASVLSLIGLHAGTAATTTPIHHTANLTCIGTAVAARESSIDGAVSTYTTSLNTDFTTRAAALAAAYSETGTTTIRTEVRAAWSNFSSSKKAAAATLKTSRTAAWTQFSTAVKACGPSAAAVSDLSNESSDSVSE